MGTVVVEGVIFRCSTVVMIASEEAYSKYLLLVVLESESVSR